MLFADFFYNGFTRWQLWFDNPNKAAVLFVELALMGLAFLASRSHIARIVGCGVALSAMYAMLRTFSRGGLLALALAGVPLLVQAVRRVRCGRVSALSILPVVVGVLTACALQMGMGRRLVHGFSGEDRSVENRLDVWRMAPRMVWDAPWGWGLGQSGNSYGQWYQPLERQERYRTLVNSHLTWLVETGIVGGMVWLLGWMAVLCFGLWRGFVRGAWLCWAEWAALFVAGIFSSVCECWELWMIPLVVLGYAVHRMQKRTGPLPWRKLSLTFASLFFAGGVVLVIVVVKGACSMNGPSLRKHGDVIFVGQGSPAFWLLPDPDVLGGDMYPREIRETVRQEAFPAFAIIRDAHQIPDDADVVVVCGAADDAGRRGQRLTVWLSPRRIELSADERNRVIVGALSAEAEAYVGGEGVVQIEGAGDYIPDWLRIVGPIVCGR